MVSGATKAIANGNSETAAGEGGYGDALRGRRVSLVQQIEQACGGFHQVARGAERCVPCPGAEADQELAGLSLLGVKAERL